jgi:hypothetical protein
MSEIVNRVSNSSLVTIDLDDFHTDLERVVFDIKDYLIQDFMLKEIEFRKALIELDWSRFRGKAVAVHCSSDAIIPIWAYLLVGSYLNKVTSDFVIGDLNALDQSLIDKKIENLNLNDFVDKPVVIKGCSKFTVSLYAYGKLMSVLQPVSKSIMYGEPCSTVPIFKKAK